MLLKFAVQNFKGFSERIEWDLTHPHGYDFHTHAIRDGVVKNGIVYGPNGSGKTNFSLAIFDIVNHLSQKMGKPDYYLYFPNANHISDPVGFEYTFRLSNHLIVYKYKKDWQGNLIEESMSVDGNDFLLRDEKSVRAEGFVLVDSIQKDFLASEHPVSLISYLWSNYPLPEEHFLSQLRRFVDTMLWYKCLDRREFIGMDNARTYVEEYIVKNNLIQEFSEFLDTVSEQKFSFEVLETDTRNPNSHPELQVRYGDDGSHVSIPFLQIASTGTQALELLFFWMKKAKNASFIFIDEFDAFYHFDLAFKVCKKLFAMPNCQVFLSSHNTYLMTNDLLRPDCNFVLCENKIKPLVDCTDKELRFAHNIEKLYRGGTFKV